MTRGGQLGHGLNIQSRFNMAKNGTTYSTEECTSRHLLCTLSRHIHHNLSLDLSCQPHGHRLHDRNVEAACRVSTKHRLGRVCTCKSGSRRLPYLTKCNRSSDSLCRCGPPYIAKDDAESSAVSDESDSESPSIVLNEVMGFEIARWFTRKLESNRCDID